jgi:two-component sensor histidine kinase
VGVAFLLRLLLGTLDHDASPFTTFYPAILFAALWGGAGAGTFAVIFGGVVAWWGFMDPRFTFVPPVTFGRQLHLAIFLASSLIIVAGADYCRRLSRSLQDAEELRNLVVSELSHRLKNKVATIQSIIAYQLRGEGNEQTRDSILQRLTTLASTDSLIEAANGQGAFLHDVITIELVPYDVSRVLIEGTKIFLPPKLALVFALLFHELATNAAKYGALSIPSGQVSIFWSVAENKLSVEWREVGRPIVAAPTHRGFGTRLLAQALGQFDGATEVSFTPSGLFCKMRLTLPETAQPPATSSETSSRILLRQSEFFAPGKVTRS